MDCHVLAVRQEKNGWVTTLDAGKLNCWSVDKPVLYTLEAENERLRFGYTPLRSFQDDQVLLNDHPIYPQCD